MAYLNANLPPIYCKVRKEYLYDLKEHKGESEDCVIFGLTSISGRALLFNIMLPNGACYWRLPISAFFQNRMTEPMCRICRRTNLNCGTVLAIGLSVTCFDWLDGVKGKFLGLDKKFYHGQYLFTIDWGIQMLISWIRSILKYLKNISVRIYWLLITAIMQLSLIIVFCGTLIVILLMTMARLQSSNYILGC